MRAPVFGQPHDARIFLVIGFRFFPVGRGRSIETVQQEHRAIGLQDVQAVGDGRLALVHAPGFEGDEAVPRKQRLDKIFIKLVCLHA